MSTTFKVQCPSCQSSIRVPAERCGTTVLCPGCKRPMQIPQPPVAIISGSGTVPVARLSENQSQETAGFDPTFSVSQKPHPSTSRATKSNGASRLSTWAILGLVLVPIGVVAAFFAFSPGSGIKEVLRNQGNRSGVAAKPDSLKTQPATNEIDVIDIYDAFQSNAAAAKQKYGGKRIIVSGVVDHTVLTVVGVMIYLRHRRDANAYRYRNDQIYVFFPMGGQVKKWDMGFEYRFKGDGVVVVPWVDGDEVRFLATIEFRDDDRTMSLSIAKLL
jgi:hypothetical protein